MRGWLGGKGAGSTKYAPGNGLMVGKNPCRRRCVVVEHNVFRECRMKTTLTREAPIIGVRELWGDVGSNGDAQHSAAA